MTPPSNAGGEGREVLARARKIVVEALDAEGTVAAERLIAGDYDDWPTVVVAVAALKYRENADDRAAYTYDVTWSCADGERLTCRDLSPRLVTARIIQAIKTSGPITIHAVEGRADDRGPALLEAAVAEMREPFVYKFGGVAYGEADMAVAQRAACAIVPLYGTGDHGEQEAAKDGRLWNDHPAVQGALRALHEAGWSEHQVRAAATPSQEAS